jgi:hypothetical protein
VNDGPERDHPAPPHGPLRSFLKLLVEADSSRFWLSRIKAIVILAAILALFAGLGYGVPKAISRFF